MDGHPEGIIRNQYWYILLNMSMLFIRSVCRGSFRAAGIFAICITALPCTLAAPADIQRGKAIAGFLGKYCLQCHDADTADGKREFESFALPITSEQQLITADGIIDQVSLKQMPPEDSDQPTDEQRLALVGSLRDSIQEARGRFENRRGVPSCVGSPIANMKTRWPRCSAVVSTRWG